MDINEQTALVSDWIYRFKKIRVIVAIRSQRDLQLLDKAVKFIQCQPR